MSFLLNGIDLSSNCVLLDEFAGSKARLSKRVTEDGRQYIFKKQSAINQRPLVLDCTRVKELTYAKVKQLEAVRDTGNVVVFNHHDGRVFNVILEQIESEPRRLLNQYADDSLWKAVLTMSEI